MTFPNEKYSIVVDGYLGFLTVNVDSSGNVSGTIQTSATPVNITGTWDDGQKKLTFSPPSSSFFFLESHTPDTCSRAANQCSWTRLPECLARFLRRTGGSSLATGPDISLFRCSAEHPRAAGSLEKHFEV
jgi:hypothetical protein